ncbi:MAG: AcrR family transcriptional regulator [Glaciecola sp.]|jgi:AcrR family transcriptional regulator|uniref:TetR/AcrR family transcriptional regulator n=1 Tax=Congregibacter sp. TaxID=2744308 RepID=UPI0039E51140
MQRARTKDAKDQRRQVLLQAALEEFFERGFAAARLDDVAQRAQLSKGTIYLYFKSKEALFEALIDSLTSPRIAQFEAIAANAPSIDEALSQIATIAPMIIRQSSLPKLMKVLIGDSHRFPEVLRNYRQNVLDRLLAAITTLLIDAQERGEILVTDPQLTARLVIAPIVFSSMWQALFGHDEEPPIDLDALFEIHRQLILNALRIQEASTC